MVFVSLDYSRASGYFLAEVGKVVRLDEEHKNHFALSGFRDGFRDGTLGAAVVVEHADYQSRCVVVVFSPRLGVVLGEMVGGDVGVEGACLGERLGVVDFLSSHSHAHLVFKMLHRQTVAVVFHYCHRRSVELAQHELSVAGVDALHHSVDVDGLVIVESEGVFVSQHFLACQLD